ncbi:facilitated trehalose transporter Tret1 [Nilaparvata lugens]|uniref:facilitated trehalose transporter Tret1 n=1 Tax=Nilaparvata lugens TaxID=108931 RepID=UPI00193EB4E2|nr:facilitated trehalose transporter Tret1 [Nilaparvata lugens]
MENTNGPTQEEKSNNVPTKSIEKVEKQEQTKQISRFRVALPQILASTAKNMILLDLGMTIAFPTIVIPALLNNHSDHGMKFSVTEASWFGSIAFICQPLGSIASGIVLEPLGRKYSLMVVNIPHFVGWLMYYFAQTTRTIFIASIIMGLGVGFMEAPIITYVGEICEPRLRGVLISYSNLFFSFGLVFIYALGNITDWQTTAAISAAIPFVTFLAITQVPETPYWLLSHGRLAEAEKSLCWLRGWVKPDAVQSEFQEMVKYSKDSKYSRPKSESAYNNEVNLDDEKPSSETNKPSEQKETNETQEKKANGECKENVKVEIKSNEKCQNEKTEVHVGDKATFEEFVKDMMRPEMIRPLALVVGFFFFTNFAGVAAMRPYQIKVFTDLGFPLDPYRATVIMSVNTFTATVLCMVFVKWLGKRRLALLSLASCSIMMFGVSLFAKLHDSGKDGHLPDISWFPFVIYFILQFFFSFGVSTVPWMLVSEIFPYRGRSLMTGLAAALSYVLSFLATKTFLGLEELLSLSGVTCLYATSSLVGFCIMYRYLPETEGRTLEEIEKTFSKKSKQTN